MVQFWKQRFALWYEEVEEKYGPEVLADLKMEPEARRCMLQKEGQETNMRKRAEADLANRKKGHLAHFHRGDPDNASKARDDFWQLQSRPTISKAFQDGFSALSLLVNGSHTLPENHASKSSHKVHHMSFSAHHEAPASEGFMLLGNHVGSEAAMPMARASRRNPRGEMMRGHGEHVPMIDPSFHATPMGLQQNDWREHAEKDHNAAFAQLGPRFSMAAQMRLSEGMQANFLGKSSVLHTHQIGSFMDDAEGGIAGINWNTQGLVGRGHVATPSTEFCQRITQAISRS
jgi:hypothetical protein